MASIRGKHFVETGESRFFSEVKAIREFIDSSSRGECRVFVIDEIFSATNTIERVASAKAVLSAISRHAQVLATTHDVELQKLLAPDFDLFHFQENPTVEGFFDFELHTGISTREMRFGFSNAWESLKILLAKHWRWSLGIPTKVRSSSLQLCPRHLF